jgi:predicted N-acetyltransferase YhbS
VEVASALPRMQALASRLWSPEARQHPGQLSWSVFYAEGLGSSPVEMVREGEKDVGWAWAESDDWVELCVDAGHPDAADDLLGWFVERAGARETATMVLESEDHLLAALHRAGFAVADRPWFTHHFLDLADLPSPPEVPGYTFRHVERVEAEQRAACHRAAWSDGGPSRVSTSAYRALMRAPYYRPELDWVALDPTGSMVASACLWLDPATGVVLVEPVGCAPDHRGRGLAGAVSVAALAHARSMGATTGLVCPRGDDGYPLPGRVYRALGFRPVRRTLTLVRPGGRGTTATR